MSDQPLGFSGLTGRPAVRPVAEPEPESDLEPAPGVSIPGPCLRRLTIPRDDGCPFACPGRQEDGGCLTDIVRLANERGVDWHFDVRETEDGLFWTYDGPPLE